ncbi:hypothetical protein BN2537_7659 [Streptomyces venezuelae]|nr:hypothetical protein BN2537_7659 [Streptomyces venezuelae]
MTASSPGRGHCRPGRGNPLAPDRRGGRRHVLDRAVHRTVHRATPPLHTITSPLHCTASPIK